MRNFVECCLGGEPFLPEMTLSWREPLEPNDVLLVCSDGLWGGLEDNEIGAAFPPARAPLRDELQRLAERVGERGRRGQRQHLRRRACAGSGTPDGCPGPAAARRMSCAPCASPAASRSTRKARCWSSSATRGCCVRRASKKACRHSCAARARAGSRRSTACCRAPRTRARAREAAQGQAERPHAGDPAAHRPLAARGDRTSGARRAHDHARLRRAAGRRRHAHRVHHRRLTSRWPTRASSWCERALIARQPAAWPDRGRLGRHLRRRAGARPRLRRGLRPPRPT